jgi:hypothetical protein
LKKFKWIVLYKGRIPVGVVYSESSWEAMKIAINNYKNYDRKDLWLETTVDN